MVRLFGLKNANFYWNYWARLSSYMSKTKLFLLLAKISSAILKEVVYLTRTWRGDFFFFFQVIVIKINCFLFHLQQGLPFVSNRHHYGGTDINSKSLAGLSSVNGWTILRRMLRHVWPKDRPDLKRRVVAAVVLLVAAKVICINFVSSTTLYFSSINNIN